MTAVALPKDLEAWVQTEVNLGRATTVEQVVVEALELRRSEVEWVRSRLDEARAQLARGEGLDGDAVLAELDAWIAEDLAKAVA